MPGARLRRPDVLAAGSAALLAVSLSLHPILTPDFWWHLASGRWVVVHRAVPHTDPFTYPAATHPWVNLQWLGDVLTYGIYRWAGADGLVLGKAAALALLAVLLHVLARRAGSPPGLSALVVSLALLASAERTMVRPEIVSFLMLAALLCLVPPAGFRRRAALLAIPALTAVWINLHALAFLAPLTVMWHGLVAWPRGEALPVRDAPGRRATVPLLLAAALSAAALLLNPYYVHAWTFPATLFERIRPGGAPSGDAFARILEFASPLDSPADAPMRFFWALLAATLVSSALPGVRSRAGRLAGVLPFLVLALLARRNVPLFAIAAVPALAANLGDVMRAGRGRRVPLAPSVVVPLLLSASVLAGASPRLLGLHRERGLGILPGAFPASCVDALDDVAPSAPLLNDMDFGGYVSWCRPDRRTFIDGRLEVGGSAHLREYLRLRRSVADWESSRARWRFGALLLQHADPGSLSLLQWILHSEDWTLRCVSPEAVLLVEPGDTPPADPRPGEDDWSTILSGPRPPEPGGGDALRVLARPLHRLLSPARSPARLRAAVHLAGLCLELGWLDEARTGYGRVLELSPHHPLALYNLGICEMRSGRSGEARRVWEEALKSVGRSERARFREALARLDRR